MPTSALIVAVVSPVITGGDVVTGHDPETGEESLATNELVRLAIPRRVYTKSHVDYVVETIEEVFEHREKIRGVTIVEQPEALRHFSATFALA